MHHGSALMFVCFRARPFRFPGNTIRHHHGPMNCFQTSPSQRTGSLLEDVLHMMIPCVMQGCAMARALGFKKEKVISELGSCCSSVLHCTVRPLRLRVRSASWCSEISCFCFVCAWTDWQRRLLQLITNVSRLHIKKRLSVRACACSKT